MEKSYNPMSKEFQEEAKILGLTGNQLITKYRKEGRSLEKCISEDRRINRRPNMRYTEEELLSKLRRFYADYGVVPTREYFSNNPECPSFMTYVKHFGSWNNALRLVGLDVESMIKRGVLVTNQQKARFAEIIVRDHFKVHPIDLVEKNYLSSFDGICPNGMNYDVKSSKLYETHYSFGTKNKFKEDIEIYYFLAFNEDYTKFYHGWRVPGEIAEKDQFLVGLNSRHKFNIENMKKYDITDDLRDVLRKHGF